MARKSPAQVIVRFCEYGMTDAEAAIAALDKAGYVIITKAERRTLERALNQTNGHGTKTGRMSVK